MSNNKDNHLGGAIEQGDSNTVMVDVWGYLLVRYELKSVLDIGCGFGHTMKWFSDNGLCRVQGIEGWDEAYEKNIMKAQVLKHDFEDGPATIATPFDLAWSAEFLEHVKEHFIPNFMAAFRMCRYAVITHGEPGQAGWHHVNCQTDAYWIKKFAKYGFEHRAEETALLRRTDRWRAGWGRRTLMFFEQA